MSSATQLDLQQLISMQQQVAKLAVRRKYIRSPLSGAHLSRLRGRGMEFDEVRVYQVGDEVSSIDWKVTARKGVTHTKMFREERERPVLICLDYRQSMFFATQGCLKAVMATQVLSLLAWHGVAHGDRLGGLLFSDQEHHEVKPVRGRKGVLKFLHACVQSSAWKKSHGETVQQSSLTEITARLRHVSKPGSLVYMLSDFRGLSEESVANLAQLARHNDVVLISITDPIEKLFPAKGEFPVFDGKSYFTCYGDKELQQCLAQQYEQRVSLLDQLRNQYGIQHIEFMTDDDVSEKVREYAWAL